MTNVPPPQCAASTFPVPPFAFPCCNIPVAPCWCDSDGGPGACPPYPVESIYVGRPEVIGFYEGLNLDNPDYDRLAPCVSDLLPPPLIPVIEAILGPEAESCPPKGGGGMCCMKFRRDGDTVPGGTPGNDCESEYLADSYEVRSFENAEQCSGAWIPLHEGECGVCSTAQDLASYMSYSYATGPDSPTLAGMSLQCIFSLNVPGTPPPLPPAFVDGVSQCLQQAAGLSDACSVAWAIDSLASQSVCGSTPGCQALIEQCTTGGGCPQFLYDVASCELNPCVQCNEDATGPSFVDLAGMTRRRAGIHDNGLPRACDAMAHITHSCVAVSGKGGKSGKSSKSRGMESTSKSGKSAKSGVDGVKLGYMMNYPGSVSMSYDSSVEDV